MKTLQELINDFEKFDDQRPAQLALQKLRLIQSDPNDSAQRDAIEFLRKTCATMIDDTDIKAGELSLCDIAYDALVFFANLHPINPTDAISQNTIDDTNLADRVFLSTGYWYDKNTLTELVERKGFAQLKNPWDNLPFNARDQKTISEATNIPLEYEPHRAAEEIDPLTAMLLANETNEPGAAGESAIEAMRRAIINLRSISSEERLSAHLRLQNCGLPLPDFEILMLPPREDWSAITSTYERIRMLRTVVKRIELYLKILECVESFEQLARIHHDHPERLNNFFLTIFRPNTAGIDDITRMRYNLLLYMATKTFNDQPNMVLVTRLFENTTVTPEQIFSHVENDVELHHRENFLLGLAYYFMMEANECQQMLRIIPLDRLMETVSIYLRHYPLDAQGLMTPLYENSVPFTRDFLIRDIVMLLGMIQGIITNEVFQSIVPEILETPEKIAQYVMLFKIISGDEGQILRFILENRERMPDLLSHSLQLQAVLRDQVDLMASLSLQPATFDRMKQNPKACCDLIGRACTLPSVALFATLSDKVQNALLDKAISGTLIDLSPWLNFEDSTRQNYFFSFPENKQLALLQLDYRAFEDCRSFLVGSESIFSQRSQYVAEFRRSIINLPKDGCLIFLNYWPTIKTHAENHNQLSRASLFSSDQSNLRLCQSVLENIYTKLIVSDMLEKINDSYQQLSNEKSREARTEKLKNLVHQINTLSNFLLPPEKFKECIINEIKKNTGIGGGLGFGKLNDALKLLVTHIQQNSVFENERAILNILSASSHTTPRI